MLIVRHLLLIVQYLDPGSGSYLFQILVAGFTTFLFFLYRIRGYLARFFTSAKKDERAE